MPKIIYIDKLADIVNESIIIHTMPQSKWSLLIKRQKHVHFASENNDKDPKFEVGNYVRISKYKNHFSKVYTPNWSEEAFVIKKVKNTVSQTDVTEDLHSEKIAGMFYEKELQIGDKWYVKWKGYNNFFEKWVVKKDT